MAIKLEELEVKQGFHYQVEDGVAVITYDLPDSPVNTLTPLMVYFPFIVTVAQRYRKEAGVGTIVAIMLPYAVIMLVAWIVLFAIFFIFNIPLGPGYYPRG